MDAMIAVVVTTFILPLVLGLFFMSRGYKVWGSILLLVAILCAPVGLVS
ncbi:hypothetical protein [Thalassobaculum sp.]